MSTLKEILFGFPQGIHIGFANLNGIPEIEKLCLYADNSKSGYHLKITLKLLLFLVKTFKTVFPS